MEVPTKADLRTEEGCWKIQAAYSDLTMRKIGKVLGITHGFISKQFGKYGIRESKKAEATPLDERTAAELLSGRGYVVHKERERARPGIVEIGLDAFEGDVIRMGAISCTHLGCSYQQLTHLNRAYDWFEKNGVQHVFHAGDLVAGQGVYAGQQYDLFKHGATAQKDYAIENYPHKEGITTYIIDGNHDHSHYKHGGYEILSEITQARPDLDYRGTYGGRIRIGGLDIYLMHGGGSTAYARSYKLQKIIEQFAPEMKPHLLLIGHWHTTCLLPVYRNVAGVSLGCFQSQTPYLRRYGLNPEIGFWVIEIKKRVKGASLNISEMAFRWFPFYKPITNDFK